MTFRLTTLGTGTVALTGERVRASHLIATGELHVLLDCGSGATQRLASSGVAWSEITHVVLTHFHIDHHADLPTLIFAWKYGQLPPRSAPLSIIGPAGTRELLQRVAAAYGEWVLAPGFDITITEIAPGDALALSADTTLRATKVPHTVESVAYSVERAGKRIVYSGDTGYDEAFADWAADCDLMLLECSLPTSMAIREHLTPEQCGAIAARARVKQLALTHFYPPVEQVDIRALVGAQYDGPVTLAYDGWHCELEDE